MIIFPAIDIRNGKCVRLIQGDYNQEKIYSNSPIEIAKKWEEKGAEYIHIVDLDGAKTGQSINNNIIKLIAKEVNIPIQVGGGIRSLNVIKDYLENGISRIIIGTAAIKDEKFLRKAVTIYGNKIAVSIDARNGYVATDGWTETSNVQALDILKQLENIGVSTVVYTDIFKDGMLQGPNLTELKTVNSASTIQVIASGGVSTKEDVFNIKSLQVYGAIIGKALYEGSLTLKTALEVS